MIDDTEIKIVQRTARVSECGTYRYHLGRRWGDGQPNEGCIFVMLNPSTADAYKDDPTIRRCVRFANRLGWTSLHVINLFAIRSADPAAIRIHPRPVGDENDVHIKNALTWATTYHAPFIVAWGPLPHASERGLARVHRVIRLAQVHRVPLQCLGTSKDGSPRHPLFLKKDAELRPWSE